jgi:uncharacterized OB-fold protein
MSGKLVPEIDDVTREYWEGTALGELRLRTCRSCEAKFRFNHAWCPECGAVDLGFQKTGGTGTVTNYTVIHVAPYEAYATEVPYALALVELDEGVRMMTNIVECDPFAVCIGMRVQVTFEERGGINLPQFRPSN